MRRNTTRANSDIANFIKGGSKLKLEIGSNLLLRSLASQSRYLAKLVGCLAGRSLLVATPYVNSGPVALMKGEIFSVRVLTGNNIYGFNSSVLRICANPYAYFHLAYPREVETVMLRKDQRVNAGFSVSVQNETESGGEQILAEMADISTSGAAFVSEQPLGKVGDTLSICASVSIGSLKESIMLPAVIRSVREISAPDQEVNQYRYGAEFRELEQKEELIIRGFVYEQLIDVRAR